MTLINRTETTNVRPDHRDDYRAEVKTAIGLLLRVGESCVVVGVAGTGKSNLVKDCHSKADLFCQYMNVPPNQYLFCLVDANSSPSELNATLFYRLMLHALTRSIEELGSSLAQASSQLQERIAKADDPLSLFYILEDAHQLLVKKVGKKVVWLIDRFDKAFMTLEPGAINSLRRLRDQYKDHLMYAVFTRQPLERLRDDIMDIGEFYDLVKKNTCWVGPLNREDALSEVHRNAHPFTVPVHEVIANELVKLTGGLPSFLKVATQLFCAGQLKAGDSLLDWQTQLLQEQAILDDCHQIWSELTDDEQATLVKIVTIKPPYALQGEALNYLKISGLVQETDSVLRIFSPIFETYIKHRLPKPWGIISIDRVRYKVLCDGVELEAHFQPLEFDLLEYLIEHEGQLCTRNNLIDHLWPDDPKIADSPTQDRMRDGQIPGLISGVRMHLEPDKPPRADGRYIRTVRGEGFIFEQPKEP